MSIDFGIVQRFYLCVIFLNFLYINSAYGNLLQVHKSILEDAKLQTHELIRKYGYKAEVHTFYTEDGYLLTAHRIVGNGQQPVLLTHGLSDSSATWVMMGPKRGLGYLLSNRGYDVWLLNVRGNRYSRKHRKYLPNMMKFWDFSFHELGKFDLPAATDYILKRTNYTQLHYIGHSQGTTSFFVMGSERPDYMKKIKSMHALAPVAFFEHIKNTRIRILAPHAPFIYFFLKFFGINEVLVNNELWRELLFKYCTFIFRNTCSFVILEMMGMDMEQFDVTKVPIILGHVPAGTSLKSVVHYAQQYNYGGFYKFRYDNSRENELHHGTKNVQPYNLTNVNCKVALYYGKNDLLTSVKDVRTLRSRLPNVIHDHLIKYPKFNHIDFVWAIDVKKLLYDDLFEVMRKVDSEEL